MSVIFEQIKKVWEFLNKISPETKSLMLILLFGYVLYSQINQSTESCISKQSTTAIQKEKEAENYTKNTAIEINRHVRLIAYKDTEAFDVLLLSYHNSKQSLQGFKFLYLSCITESPKSIDTPLLKSVWTNMDYIYYVDELEKIHNQEMLLVKDIEKMKESLPKLYRLIKLSEAEAASFYVIEGKNSPIGIVLCLYKETPKNALEKSKIIMPSIQKLAILLDYENQ